MQRKCNCPAAMQILSGLLAVLLFTQTSALRAQVSGGAEASSESTEDEDSLAVRQARLSERFTRLELLAGRLSELSQSTQPRRARLLRELVSKSRERDIPGRFSAIIDSLEQENLGVAADSQTQLQADLQVLLELLLQEDRDSQIEAERERIRKYLAEVNRLIQSQRGIKARTEGGDETSEVTEDQQRLADSTGKLQEQIQATEGRQSDPEAGTQDTSAEQNDASSAEKSSNPAQQQPNEGRPSKNGEPGKQEEPQDSSQEKPPAEQSGEGEQSSDPSEQGEQSQSPQQGQQGQPQQGQPQQGQPQQGQPQQGQPQQGQPQQGQPQQGQPSPSDSSQQPQTPAEKAQQNLKQAQQRMQQALENLKQAQQENAHDRQEEALRELEQAKAELERILRQLREEELERMLVMLEARFRKMLDAQVVIYEETKQLEASQANVPEHEVEIASGRLSRQEQQIVREAERALVLLREDGTTVAFPESIEQARDDMVAVAERLSDVKLGIITQGLEEDIIAALEETLAALQQALKEARENRSRPQQGQPGEPGEQPLVDQLAELRMIRALQNRVNRRTQRYGEILGDEPAIEQDLREALEQLAERQERIFDATRDLDTQRNR